MTVDKNHDDEEWIALLSAGDRTAFEGVYRKYAAALYRYARKNIDVKEDCEEIIQDVFESLWGRRERLSQVKALEPYLFRMVKYMVVRYFQRRAVRKKYAEHFRLFEAVYDSMHEPELLENGLQALIAKGIAQLPERCQQVLRLRLTENLSNGDIAARMHIKKSTVENYIVAALSHLRAIVNARQSQAP